MGEDGQAEATEQLVSAIFVDIFNVIAIKSFSLFELTRTIALPRGETGSGMLGL
jgi:hypothetical protein